MTRSSRILAVVLAIAVAHLPSATAQPVTAPGNSRRPSREQLDRSRLHFKAAEAAKVRAEYQTAAIEYLAAYQEFEDPEFFFDTADVYRLAGDVQCALTYYEKYLENDSGGRGAAIARSTRDELRRLIAAKPDAACRCREVGAPRKDDDGAGCKVGSTGHPIEPGPVITLPLPPSPPPSPPSPPPPPPGRRLRIAGVATGALGVVALGAGTGFGLRAHRLSNELSMAGVFDRKRYDEGRAAEYNFVLYSGVGAAGVVAGAVLYYLAARADRAAATDAALTIAPVVAPSRLTVTVSGRF